MMRTRNKWLLIAAALVCGLLVAAYVAAPWLIARIALAYLNDYGRVQSLEIASVGPQQIQITNFVIANEHMQFAAQDGVVTYDPWPFQIRNIAIAQAHLTLMQSPNDARRDIGQITLPQPPRFPVQINKLVLDSSTPWGALTLPMSIDVSHGSSGGLVAEIHANDVSLRLTNPGPHQQQLVMRVADESPLLTLNAQVMPGNPIAFEGDIRVQAIAQWLTTSALVPPQLQTAMQPFDVISDGLSFAGTLQRNQELEIKVAGDIQMRDHRPADKALFSSIALHAKNAFRIKHAGNTWSSSGDATFTIKTDSATQLSGRDLVWQWDDKGIDIRFAQATLKPIGVDARLAQIKVTEFDNASANGQIRLNALNVDGWPPSLAHYDVVGNWSWHDATLKANGSGNAAGLPAVQWQLQTDGAQGLASLTTKAAMASLAPSLAHYTAAIAPDLKIQSGQLNGQYRLNWNAKNTRCELKLSADSVDATLGAMAVHGLQAQLENQGNALAAFDLHVSASTLKLGSGTTASTLRLRARAALPVIHLDELRGKLFDGSFALQPASINLKTDSYTLVADIHAMALEPIMALLDQQSVQLNGKVSGSVRMVVHASSGVEINEARLHSIEPGVLKVSTGSSGSDVLDQDSNIALRALQNFQYKNLSASVLYKPNGQYEIRARIVGDNPAVLDGHVIAFNPVIEGQLPQLLRAFFVTGDFTKAIIERLHQNQETLPKQQTAPTH